MRHLATVLLMVSMSCIADGPPGDPPSHAWKKLRWLEGCWRGTGLGGEITECWVGSGNGIYTGVFLADFDGEPAMRVRHFHPDFSQWESDKGTWIRFPLVAIENHRIVFEGLEYRLAEDSIEVSLDMKSRDGSSSTQRFTLRKLGSE